MRNIFNIIIFLITFNSFSQENRKSEIQIERYNKALDFISEGINSKAMSYLYSAHFIIPNSEIGIKALGKYDSIKPHFRKELINKIQGTWRLTKYGTNWGFTNKNNLNENENILEITKNELHFYEQNIDTKERNLLKIEKLEFAEPSGFYSSCTDITFSDNQIWNYSLKGSKDILYAFNTGQLTENSRTVMSCGNSENYYERIK